MTREINKWVAYKSWHDLLNAVCLERNYLGNSELTFLLCQERGKNKLKDTEAIARSLSNWRSGANLPTRANLRTLTKVLKISSNSKLEEEWYRLYQYANHKNVYAELCSTKDGIKVKSIFNYFSELNWKVKTLLFSFLALVFIVGVWNIASQTHGLSEVDRIALNNIPWRKYVTLHVGEEIVIHGKRGNCGEFPKSSEKIQKELPTHSKIGVFKIGKLGMRNSRQCNGATPAREIIFRGIKTGTETFYLYGDDVTVLVTD